MNHFGEYITPEKAKSLGDPRSLAELKIAAKSKKKCEVCGQPAWRYGGLGMCFSCTTGEADPSEDYELKQS